MVLDGTETQTDVTLRDETTETPEELPTVTQAHMEAQIRQARSAALADVGRLQREAANAVKAVTAAQERIKKMLKEQEEAELEAAEGNSEQLSAVRERQRRRQMESELDTVKLELDGKNERLSQLEADRTELTRTQTAREIAVRLGVDPNKLIKFSKLTDGSPEAIEDIARDLPKMELRPLVKGDSGVSSGGKAIYTQEQISNYDFWAKNKDDIELARHEGRIK